MTFPKEFIWGAASSAYQIEGAVSEGGRTATIWDTFCSKPGKIFAGQDGTEACDAYHRWQEDLDLLAATGAKNYRFGIGWSRIFPTSDEQPNSEGLAYYDAVVDGCIARGLEPWITLYHWDLPQYLDDNGGWLCRETAQSFGHLCQVVAEHFQGRVTRYFTLNEPQCSAELGYGNGIHAPGLTLTKEEVFRCMHNLALAHGYGTLAIRKADKDALVGIASTGRLCYPKTETPTDIEAARKATFAVLDEDWCFTHHWFLDAVMFGHYPACQGTFLDVLTEQVDPQDFEIIHQVPDFLGLNIYNGHEVTVDEHGNPQYVDRYRGYPRTALKWPVTPEVMCWGPLFLQQRYQLPMYITENGQSCNDRIFLDGKVHDADRIDFLQGYLLQLAKGIHLGSDVRGYFHWSLTDNFEWSNGYDDRFGLIYIDYRTQQRIPKDSYFWYSDLIKTQK